MKKWIPFLLLTIPIHLMGQVESDRPIHFTGQDDSLRQISSLDFPTDSVSAISAGNITSNLAIYGSATGTDSITITINPPVSGYVKGMQIIFKASAANTKPVMIRINNLGFVALQDQNGEAIPGGRLTPGMLATALFDGSVFRLTIFRDNECPPGFVKVTKDYCIEVNERAVAYNYTAAEICYSLNARLCTWAEWHYACQDTSLNLSAMTGNWEWIDDSANHGHTVSQTGEINCKSNRSITVPFINPFNYRCCFSR